METDKMPQKTKLEIFDIDFLTRSACFSVGVVSRKLAQLINLLWSILIKTFHTKFASSKI